MSEPQRKIRFPELSSLRDRLQAIHERGPHSQTVESTLVQLVDGLEELAYKVQMQIFIGENFDNLADIRNLQKLETDLEKVSKSLQLALGTRNAFFHW